MQHKTTLRFCIITVRTAFPKKSNLNNCWWGCGNLYLFSIDKITNWYQHYRNQGDYFSKSRSKIPHITAILFLGILTKYSILFCKYTCSVMFIVTPFTIARILNQLRCSSSNEWIIKIYICKKMKFYDK